jgi:hypothetical protein
MPFLYDTRRDVIKSLIKNPPKTHEGMHAAIQAYQMSQMEIQSALMMGKVEQEDVMDDTTLLAVLWGVIEDCIESDLLVPQAQFDHPVHFYPGNDTLH